MKKIVDLEIRNWLNNNSRNDVKINYSLLYFRLNVARKKFLVAYNRNLFRKRKVEVIVKHLKLSQFAFHNSFRVNIKLYNS